MRRLLALAVLVMLAGSSAVAQGPSGSAQQTMTVSVEVVRPCAIDARGGSASVTCGQRLATQASVPSNAPKPLVTDSAQSADSIVTVEF